MQVMSSGLKERKKKKKLLFHNQSIKAKFRSVLVLCFLLVCVSFFFCDFWGFIFLLWLVVLGFLFCLVLFFFVFCLFLCFLKS